MSDTQLQDSVTTAHSTATPGELLSRQRESLGVPLSDAARALNLRPAVVDGLEKDNYEEIPVAAYRRGYLRAYAKYLGMDDRVVLEAYQARHGASDNERKVAPVSVSKPPSKMGAWLFKLVTLLVIVGLIAVTVAWWQSRGGSEPPSMGTSPAIEENEAPASDIEPAQEPMPAMAPEPAVTEELTNDEASEPAESVSTAPAAATDEPAAQIIDADATTEVAAAPTAETETVETEEVAEEAAEAAPAAATPNLLELTFNEQSWTEIFDANNQRVFVGLQTPGTTASVEGEPPFRLTIGNATGVELRYQGEVVNLAQRAGANNVARFTLGE